MKVSKRADPRGMKSLISFSYKMSSPLVRQTQYRDDISAFLRRHASQVCLIVACLISATIWHACSNYCYSNGPMAYEERDRQNSEN